MSDHKFGLDDPSVHAGTFGRGTWQRLQRSQVLPAEGDDRQYRIKSANEPHERVVKTNSSGDWERFSVTILRRYALAGIDLAAFRCATDL